VRPPARRDREPSKDESPALEGNIRSAADLRPGDRVVYPNQGVCAVAGLEQKDIAGQRLEFVRMTREEDGASVMVPIPKVASIGLRRVASASHIEGVFHYLGASFDDPELDWKVRHRDNVERLIAGGVLGVAEVVKGLHSLSRLRPLPAKERELYDSSRHLLVSEVAVSLGVPASIAEDYVDYALAPPAGVKLPLKPPPRPVELKGPPWKRKKPAAEGEGEDDLGLAELGLDLAEIEGTGGDADEGEEGAKAGGEAEGAPAEAEPRPAKGKPPARNAEPAGKGEPARKPAPAAPRRAPPAPPRKAPPAPAGKGAPGKRAAAAAKPAPRAAPRAGAARKPAPRPARPAARKAAKPAKPAKARKPAGGKKR
jgi:RNA polymerase-interacting CarD/CdnL/TRCF family regulator